METAEGFTAPGFEGVRRAFDNNFVQGLEVGTSFSAYRDGEKVVDLWGGVADSETGRAWDENTIAVVFSTTKGITAMCRDKLAQEGKLDMDTPVAEYWPEFAAGGKETIPVSYLLSHQAGLAWIDGEMTAEEAFAWDPVVDALARQVPHWEPGTKHGYHATTYGWLVGEVIRRVTDKSVGRYLRDEIATPLDLDFWIGLPEEEEPRVATLEGWVGELLQTADPGVRDMINQFMGPETVLGKSLYARVARGAPDIYNSRALHAAEIPAAGGIGDARSLARVYAACIGDVDGFHVLDAEQMKKATTQQTSGPNTVLMDMDIQFGLGFMVQSTLIQLGGPNSFGHFGAGGSVGWADPDAGLAFGYVMNRMDMGLAGDARSVSLVNACYDAIRWHAPAINPDAEFERHELEGGSWVEIARGWITGADAVYEHLVSTVSWQQGKVWRYERYIDEPRMGAGGSLRKPHHPVLADAHLALQKRYAITLDGFGLAYYRNERDSVAMHRDREMKWLEDTVVSIVTFDATRTFLVQRRDTRDASTARDLRPAAGDLMVFGGRFQSDYLHGVPKMRTPVRGRISAQWRYTSKRGAPDTNPGYYEPREFFEIEPTPMSINVNVEDIRAVAEGQAPFAYFVSVSADESAHMIAIRPAIGTDAIVCEVGKTSRANAAARPVVSLLWPPATPEDYSLIVDGTTTVDGETVRITPTRAVRHRPAPGGGNDCAPVGT